MENILKIVLILALFIFLPRWIWSQKSKSRLALLRPEGDEDRTGRDYLTALIGFCNEKLGSDLAREAREVHATGEELAGCTYLFLAVTRNTSLTGTETENLRQYLADGGFLHLAATPDTEAAAHRLASSLMSGEGTACLPETHGLLHLPMETASCADLHLTAAGREGETSLVCVRTGQIADFPSLYAGANILHYLDIR